LFKLNLNKNIKYKICSCGISKKLPFCDNEHRKLNTANNPEFKSIKIISEKDVSIIIESKKWISSNDE